MNILQRYDWRDSENLLVLFIPGEILVQICFYIMIVKLPILIDANCIITTSLPEQNYNIMSLQICSLMPNNQLYAKILFHY